MMSLAVIALVALPGLAPNATLDPGQGPAVCPEDAPAFENPLSAPTRLLVMLREPPVSDSWVVGETCRTTACVTKSRDRRTLTVTNKSPFSARKDRAALSLPKSCLLQMSIQFRGRNLSYSANKAGVTSMGT